MLRNLIIVGNWKMNPASGKEAERIFKSVQNSAAGQSRVVICPPALYLSRLKKIPGKTLLGGQNCFPGEAGAFTGEISSEMLYDAGARYVILGHSERRTMGETNAEINGKIRAALVAGLSPILCVGEKERDEGHKYLDFIKEEAQECLKGVAKNSFSGIILAYEPVWAIDKSATRESAPEEFREMYIFLRRILSDKFGREAAEKVRILYGGSVSPKNAAGFLSEGGADGFLIGRASLDPKKFSKIIELCDQSGN